MRANPLTQHTVSIWRAALVGLSAFCLLIVAAPSSAFRLPCYCDPIADCYPPPSGCTYEQESEDAAHAALTAGVSIDLVQASHGNLTPITNNDPCNHAAYSNCTAETFDATLDLEFRADPNGPAAGFSRSLSLSGPVTVERESDSGGAISTVQAALTDVFVEITPADADPDFAALQIRAGEAQGLPANPGEIDRRTTKACTTGQNLCHDDAECTSSAVETRILGAAVPSLPYAIDATAGGQAATFRMSCGAGSSTLPIQDLGGGVRGAYLTLAQCNFVVQNCFISGDPIVLQFEDPMAAPLGSSQQENADSTWVNGCTQSVQTGNTALPNVELFGDFCAATNNFHSRYNVSYQVSYVGASGGPLDGLSDTFTGSAVMSAGVPFPPPKATPALGRGPVLSLLLLLTASALAVGGLRLRSRTRARPSP